MAVAKDSYFPVEGDETIRVRLLQGADYSSPFMEYNHVHSASERNNGARSSLVQLNPRNDQSGFSANSRERTSPKKCINFGIFFLIVLVIAVMFLFGVGVGFYVRELQMDKPDVADICGEPVDEEKNKAELNDRLGGYHESLAYFVRAQGIRDFVEDIGSHEIRTGDNREIKLADKILQQFQSYSIGSVNVEEYEVVVTSPDPVRPNELEVLYHNGSRLQHFVFQSNRPLTTGNTRNLTEQDKTGKEDTESYTTESPHVTFSPEGVVSANLVYGHYGRHTDFMLLRHLGVDVKDTVVLLRMGRLSVAQKIRIAEQAGAKAVLLYWHDSDAPFETPDGMNISDVVPFTSVWEYSMADSQPWYPSVPCQTISSKQATSLLTLTLNPSLHNSNDLAVAPDQWQGLSQVPFGVGLRNGNGSNIDSPLVKVSVYNKPQTRWIRNIVYTIEGTLEPDLYVVVGAPRASQPGQPSDEVVSSSILVQLARAFEHVHRLNKYIPSRGVKLVSWGGADLADLAMAMSVRKQHHLLGRRMLAYIDLSSLVIGDVTLHANIPASLKQLFNEVGFYVPDPRDMERTLQETWKNSFPAQLPLGTYQGEPTHYAFLRQLAVPHIHIQYTGKDSTKTLRQSEVSQHEHKHHYKFHLAIARVVSLAMLTILDNKLLPFDLPHTIKSVHDTIWQTSLGLEECSGGQYNLADALMLCEELETKGKAFSELTQQYLNRETDDFSFRSINNAALYFERIFIVMQNGRFRHLLQPLLSDGSLAVLSEVCQVGDIIGDWNMTLTFQKTLDLALSEALSAVRIGP